MGSQTFPILGSKITDMRNSPNHGEMMYVRGGAAAFGDVKMAGPGVSDAAITATKPYGSADSAMANVVPVAAGTSDVNLRFADFRVCNATAGVVDDGQGPFLGEKRVLCWAKVTTAGGSIAKGTLFVATDAQVHLTEADLSQDGYKVVFQVAYTQTLAAGVALCAGYFDGVNGFGFN